MNKFIIKIIFIVFTFSSFSCSYEPIFSDKKYNFGIEKISFVGKGEKDANRIIERKFDLIQEVNYKNLKKYIISIKTSKNTKIVSKDSKGDPVKFELILTADYNILEKEKVILSKKIERKNIYDNNSDKFKLKQTEKIILENLANNITDMIISSLTNLNDN